MRFPGMKIHHRARLCGWLLGVLLAGVSCSTVAADAFDVAPARAALRRWLPHHEAQIVLVTLDAGKGDRYAIRGEAGHIEVAGTTPAVLLAGVEAYLEQVPHVSIGWPGDSLSRVPATLTPPPAPIESRTVVPESFALHDRDAG